MLKSYLAISCGYEFGIDFKENGTKEYFTTRGPYGYEHWARVDKETFVKDLKKFSWILDGSNKELRQEYIDLLEQEGVSIEK